MKPSLVVFDLDNTLYRYDECDHAGMTALVRRGAAETGLPESAFRALLKKSRSRVKARLGPVAASHSRLLYIHDALSDIGFAGHVELALKLEQEFWREFLIAMRPREGVEDLVLSLRSNNIPIALVTDLTLQIQLRKLVILKLENLFDVIVASEETAGDKESGFPFELLVQRSHPHWLRHVWFVGDGVNDGPVNELTAKGLIQSGVYWQLRGKTAHHGLEWSEISDIEKKLEGF